jgi:voltage-gated potassium channel
MTTVGYGDITPKTDLGRLIASMMMLLGWGTLAVPTGIVTADMSAARFLEPMGTRTCHQCLSEGHSTYAAFRTHCGSHLSAYSTESPANAGS